MPPFKLSAEQRAQIDAVRSDDAKTMLLQIFSQQHCAKHQKIIGVWGSLDPATFTRAWLANEAAHMEEAFAAYTNETETMARPAESYCLGWAA